MPTEWLQERVPFPSTDLLVPFGVLLNFVLILCRSGGMMVYLPIPGIRTSLEIHRVVLAVLLALLLLPWAGTADPPSRSLSQLLTVAGSEAALGLALGLCVALIQEGLQVGAQMVGLQAGYSYASTIDPSSNADSALLQVLMNLASSLLFLAMGMDRVLFRFLLKGVKEVPPGSWSVNADHLSVVMNLFQALFVDAIRSALPVVAILMMIDISLSLLSRLQPQLQLLSLSFPLKMLAAIAFIAISSPLLPGIVERSAARSIGAVQFLLRPAEASHGR